uniref:Synaptotagmin-like 4 n=1 Tax=Paramormyrops kingsleyae TaxID=1676925 RepID=A0A3B3RM78_9TELE
MLQQLEVNVAFLTDSERELILEVLQRDEELRKAEEQRVRRLKAELLDIRRRGAKRSSGSYSERSCGRCQAALGRLSVGASQCSGCNHRVCSACRSSRPDGSWACSVCAKEADLKKTTGDWFYDQRVNRFLDSPGHDMVRVSLRKRPQGENRKLPPATSCRRRISLISSERMHQRSDTESVEKASLSSSRTGTESSHGTPVLSSEGDLDRLVSVGRGSDMLSCHLYFLPFGFLPESNWPTSVLDLREAGSEIDEGSMRDRSKSVPGLNMQVSEEEDEDIDSLVEIHRKNAGRSTYSLRSKSTMGSLMSVYSEAGDYDTVDVSGDIIFSLHYDDRSQTLSILIKECRSLAYGNAAKHRCNPYVKCYLLPDKSRQSKKKTTVKSNTVNPIYNETLKYSISRSQLVTRSLQLSVWHHDRFGRNAFLGEVELPLDCRDLNSSHEECVPLRPKVSRTRSAFAQYKGELMISLKFVAAGEDKKKKKTKDEGGELHVLIKEAKNLTAMKKGGISDSFVKGYLLPDKTKATKRKTPVVKKTLNPHYDHTFVYKGLSLEQLQGMCLELTVWDREAMSSNDFLGGVLLSSGPEKPEYMDEACLWRKMMQYPGSWAEGTLPLRSSMGNIK